MWLFPFIATPIALYVAVAFLSAAERHGAWPPPIWVCLVGLLAGCLLGSIIGTPAWVF